MAVAKGLRLGSRGMWRWEIVGALALVRVLMVLVAGEPVISNDSMRYWNPEDPFMVFRIDLAQGPGQLVQVLFLLLPAKAAIVVQTFAAGMLWGWAAIVAANSRVWLFLLGMAWSMSPWWTQYDNRVLTEALTLAGLALLAAGVGRLLTDSRASWTPALVGLAVAVLSRPLVIVLVAPFVVVVLMVRSVRSRLPRWAVLPVAALVVWAGVQAVVFNASLAHYHYLPEPQSMKRIQAQDRFAVRMNVPGYKDAARAAGLPSCAEVDRILQMRTGEPLDALRASRETCPELADWLDAGGLPWPRELLANPVPTLVNLVSWTTGLTDRSGPVGWLLHKWVMWASVTAGAVVLLWPGRRWWVWALCLGACLGFTAAVLLASGLEYWRHMAPSLPVLGLLALSRLARPVGSGQPGRFRVGEDAGR